MIHEELLNNGTLIRHYTDDETKDLLQIETGLVYGDAIDVVPCPYTYKEVDKAQDDDDPDENQ